MVATKEELREYVYQELFKLQGGRCSICNIAPMRQRLCIDHDHKTGKVRGLLCDQCNRGLGFFQDNPAMLEYAITYLKNRHDRIPDRDYESISSHVERTNNKLELYDLQFHTLTKGKYANNRTLDKNKSALPVSQWCVSCGNEGEQHILEKRVATRRKAAKPPREKFFRNQTIKKS